MTKKETMRHARSVATIAILSSCTGCALVHHLDEYTVAPPEAAEPAPSSTGVATVGFAPDAGADAAGRCVVSSDCARAVDAEAGPSVCVKGACMPLLSPDCRRVAGDPLADDAVVLGGLFHDEGDDAERAARLAVEEISPKKHVALLACDEGEHTLRAATHLAGELHLPAVLGPSRAEDVVAASQQVTVASGTLLFTSSVASPIASLVDDDLVWRGVPSDDQRAKLVIDQIGALETVLRTTRGTTTIRFAMLHGGDVLGTSAGDAVRGKLTVNGRFLSDPSNAANVSDDAYTPGDAAGMAAIATRWSETFKPDIVFLTSEEQIAGVVVPLEQALVQARAVAKPFYVLAETCRTAAVLDAIAKTLPLDIRRRIRGVGVQPEVQSARIFEGFRTAYQARWGAAPSLRAAEAYDAVYALTLALATSRKEAPSGGAAARGLRKLGVGDALGVGPDALTSALDALAREDAVSLRGTTAKLAWDASGDVAAGTLEVWCVGSSTGAPAFGSSGVTMDVATQVVGGAFVQCQ